MKVIKCENGHNNYVADNYKKNKTSQRRCFECKKDILFNIIKENDGYLLSELKISEKLLDDTYLNLQCKNLHSWTTRFEILKRGAWCKNCSEFKSENICRLYFEQIFNCKFDKVSPDFLKYDNGINLELDGFNSNLNIAFEHQGIQHFKIIKKFKMNEESLIKIQNHDNFKKIKCEENNIKLFIINSLGVETKLKDLKQCIFDQALKFNINHLGNFDIEINLSSLYNQFNDIEKLNNIKKVSELNGGICTSERYINNILPLDFVCKQGHKWSTSACIITSGSWCPDCSKLGKYSIGDMHNYADKMGGWCLSETYLGLKIPLKWMCKNFHIWETKPQTVLYKNTWCVECFYESGGRYRKK